MSAAQTSLSAPNDPQGFALRADQPAFLTANLGQILLSPLFAARGERDERVIVIVEGKGAKPLFRR